MLEEATLTSKGQITIPKTIRDAFNLREGSKLVFMLENGEVALLPKIGDPFKALERLRGQIVFTEAELKGMVKSSKKEWSKLE